LLRPSQQHLIAGWNPIPWNHNDPTWPMPIWPGSTPRHKQVSQTRYWRQAATGFYERDAWLRRVTLDQLGIELERGIHGWMHMHWSAPQPSQVLGTRTSDDWLGNPFSSHVNAAFWKLHGWIDDRIGQWERASRQRANFAGIWLGPFPSHGASARPRASTRAGEAQQHRHDHVQVMINIFEMIGRRRAAAWRFPIERAEVALERLRRGERSTLVA
jgi:hypothetical protein